MVSSALRTPTMAPTLNSPPALPLGETLPATPGPRVSSSLISTETRLPPPLTRTFLPTNSATRLAKSSCTQMRDKMPTGSRIRTAREWAPARISSPLIRHVKALVDQDNKGPDFSDLVWQNDNGLVA